MAARRSSLASVARCLYGCLEHDSATLELHTSENVADDGATWAMSKLLMILTLVVSCCVAATSARAQSMASASSAGSAGAALARGPWSEHVTSAVIAGMVSLAVTLATLLFNARSETRKWQRGREGMATEIKVRAIDELSKNFGEVRAELRFLSAPGFQGPDFAARNAVHLIRERQPRIEAAIARLKAVSLSSPQALKSMAELEKINDELWELTHQANELLGSDPPDRARVIQLEHSVQLSREKITGMLFGAIANVLRAPNNLSNSGV